MAPLGRWFTNKNIQSKLQVIHLLVLAFALLPVVISLIFFEYFALQRQAMQEIRVQAEIVSDNVLASLAFGDDITATEALNTLDASPDIVEALLFQTDGNLLAHYSRQPLPAGIQDFAIYETQQETLTWTHFILIKPLFFHSELVGNLKLTANLDSFYHRVFLYILVISLSILGGFLISLFFAEKLKEVIVKPLSDLMNAVNQVSEAKDYSVNTLIKRTDEIGDLSRAFHEMLAGLKERDDRLNDLAFYDNVTGLPNRHFFKEHIERVVHNALRYQYRCCLMFIDLDDFKLVNDTRGHHIGDALLKVIGERLTALLREDDLICRIGGDEFAVVINKLSDLQVAELLAKRIIETIAQPAEIEGYSVTVGASIGISTCPNHASETYALLQTADTAMYVAKKTTKNTYHVFDPVTDTSSA